MKEIITLCGDNCLECPRYLAHTSEELLAVAKLWYKAGFRDQIVSNEEIACSGCSSHKNCTYHLIDCTRDHGVSKCNLCTAFPCVKIEKMLEQSSIHQKRCEKDCTPEEYAVLTKAFFEKEVNLRK